MTTKKRTKKRTRKPKHTFHNEINVVIHNSKSKGGKSKGTKTNHSNVPYNQSLRAQTAFNNTPITIPAPPRGENQNQLNDLALNYIRNQQPLILPPPPAQEMILPPSPPQPKKRSTSNIRLVKDLVFSNSNNPAYLKTVRKMGDLKKIARDKYGISDELLKQMNSKNKNDYIDRYFGLNGGGGGGGIFNHRPTTIINEETDAAESNDLLGQLDTAHVETERQINPNDLSFNGDFQLSEPDPMVEVVKKKRGGQIGSKRGSYKKRDSH